MKWCQVPSLQVLVCPIPPSHLYIYYPPLPIQISTVQWCGWNFVIVIIIIIIIIIIIVIIIIIIIIIYFSSDYLSKNAIDLENTFFCFLIEINCFNRNEMFLIWIIFV